MHLVAHPPSDGAQRFAWFIGKAEDPEALLERLVAGIRSGPAMIDRLLGGEVVPEGVLASAIARETEGEVLPVDWLKPAKVGWFDAPEPRADAAAADTS